MTETHILDPDMRKPQPFCFEGQDLHSDWRVVSPPDWEKANCRKCKDLAEVYLIDQIEHLQDLRRKLRPDLFA